MTQSKTLIFFAKIIAFSFAIGAMTTLLNTQDGIAIPELFVGGVTGAMIGAGCLVFEVFWLSNRSIRWLRKVPIAIIVVMRATAYSLIIVISLVLPALVFLGRSLWQEPDFLFSFSLSISIAVAISTALELFQLLGREASLAVFTGRYRRPRLENRIVMFADLTGSTAMAERLGELRFHELLGDVAYDLDVPIANAGGEIHRYVGDAIIATWPMVESKNFERGLVCAAEMVGTLKASSATYSARYGQELRIRVALHCGPVAAGEVGAWKKEIALLGDTMNSAARIESAARAYGADIVVSDTFKGHLPDTWQARLRRLPDYAAHGKHDALRLWALDARRDADGSQHVSLK
ncbi:adenylate/guanylate cyclase domain-containing protein [uncultured Tateyamaria sp.]|uniref:adenylate/guanylate cyclase domain-containing protein n=1 Tax=uncultured Tateyamaria sp. TaxID=455651 RepID=UPI00262A9F0C|nr:adenylate/guanylate cyclase domain-containing protein [uncultured Tateyamaria sp.]